MLRQPAERPKGETSIEDLHEFNELKLKEFIEGLGGARQDWVDALILQDDDTVRVQSGNGVTIRKLGVEQRYHPEINRAAVYQKYTSQSIPDMNTIFPKFPLPKELGEWKSAALGNQFVLSTFKKKVEWLIEYDKARDFITKLSVGVNPSLMVREVYFDHPESSNGVAVPRLVFEVLHRTPETIEDTSSIMGFIAYVFNSIEVNPGLDPRVFELSVPDGTRIFRYSGGGDGKGGVRHERAGGSSIVDKAALSQKVPGTYSV